MLAPFALVRVALLLSPVGVVYAGARPFASDVADAQGDATWVGCARGLVECLRAVHADRPSAPRARARAKVSGAGLVGSGGRMVRGGRAPRWCPRGAGRTRIRGIAAVHFPRAADNVVNGLAKPRRPWAILARADAESGARREVLRHAGGGWR